MDTMTIAFDDKNMVSVIRDLINSMKGVRILSSSTNVNESAATVAVDCKKHKISPLIKAMETGFRMPEDISEDYKKEIAAMRENKRYSRDS